MTCDNIKTVKRVAVIGAGPGGLSVARVLRNEDYFETIIVYERNDRVGGTWNYSPKTNVPPLIPCTNPLTNDDTLQHPNVSPSPFTRASIPICPIPSCVIRVFLINTGQNVYHLNNYIFYNTKLTLSFIILPMRVALFSLMQSQAVVVARYLSGKDNGLMMTMEREIEYIEKLGAWAEGWTDSSIDHWHSDDPVTGRLSEEWKETRKAMLTLRKEFLSY